MDKAPETEFVVCSFCGGSGRNRFHDGPTDRSHIGFATSEMAWRGYYPTNLCGACDGRGGRHYRKKEASA